MSAAVVLAGYAALLLGAACWLRRARWVHRAPRLGIVSWYALAVGVVLAIGLSGLVLMVPTLPWTADLTMLFQACVLEMRSWYGSPARGLFGVLGLAIVLFVLARLLHHSVVAYVGAVRQRRDQRDLLALVARRDPALDALVVDHDVAAAYCLPGRRRQIVLTRAALAALSDEQVGAVLAHEEAHLRGRHHLVIASIRAIELAFPYLPVLRHAREEITRLVELAADDAAARKHSHRTVAGALVALAESGVPAGGLAASGRSALVRVRRLLAPPRPLGVLRTLAGSVAVSLLVAMPVLVAVAPAAIVVATSPCPYAFAGHPMPPPP